MSRQWHHFQECQAAPSAGPCKPRPGAASHAIHSRSCLWHGLPQCEMLQNTMNYHGCSMGLWVYYKSWVYHGPIILFTNYGCPVGLCQYTLGIIISQASQAMQHQQVQHTWSCRLPGRKRCRANFPTTSAPLEKQRQTVIFRESAADALAIILRFTSFVMVFASGWQLSSTGTLTHRASQV